MQALQDSATVQHYQHGQEPTSASTVVASVLDPHSRVPTEVDTIPLNPIKVDAGLSDKVPPVIPVRTTDHRRTLVICFDGTGDQFQNDNSNIVKFVSMLTKEEDKQLAGVGTYNTPQIVNPWRAKIRLWIDLVFAGSLDAHIMGGYEFLMQNYRHGDKISIFGFSRGAYTARCLAGVLDIVGLLPPGNQQQVPFLYRIYRDTFVKTTISGDESLIASLKLFQVVKGWFKSLFRKPGPSPAAVAWEQAVEFKKAFSVREVTIDFLGVWDTVESVGLVPAQRPFAPSDGFIRVFRHALSLDEHRSKFRPEFWTRPTKFQLTEASITTLQKPTLPPTSVEEVWFAGCHCDVGGGSVSDKVPYSLARIPLRWMVRECFKSNTGILFHADKFPGIGMDPASVHRGRMPIPKPLIPTEQFMIKTREKNPLPIDYSQLLKDQRCQSLTQPGFLGEEEEELRDTMEAVYDAMEIHPLWKIVEYLPLAYRYQTADNDWKIGRSRNKGDPRIIPLPQLPEKLKVHRSVKTRMMAEYGEEALRAKGKGYKPRPVLFHGDDFKFEEQVQWVG